MTVKNPYKSYNMDDWKWEFLRRNPRYVRAYSAIEWLKRRYGYDGPFKGLGLERPTSANILETTLRNAWSLWKLAPPHLPASEFARSPIIRMPVHYVVAGQTVYIPSLREQTVVVIIDTRYRMGELVADLKKIIRNLLPKQRSQVRKYKDYLNLWDLRQQGLTADQIAPKLWPKEYEQVGGRDFDTGEKSALIQKVYDYEKGAIIKKCGNR